MLKLHRRLWRVVSSRQGLCLAAAVLTQRSNGLTEFSLVRALPMHEFWLYETTGRARCRYRIHPMDDIEGCA